MKARAKLRVILVVVSCQGGNNLNVRGIGILRVGVLIVR
jgi:hypothetical protein